MKRHIAPILGLVAAVAVICAYNAVRAEPRAHSDIIARLAATAVPVGEVKALTLGSAAKPTNETVVGVTATQIDTGTADPKRKFLSIQNLGSGTIYCTIGSDHTALIAQPADGGVWTHTGAWQIATTKTWERIGMEPGTHLWCIVESAQSAGAGVVWVEQRN